MSVIVIDEVAKEFLEPSFGNLLNSLYNLIYHEHNRETIVLLRLVVPRKGENYFIPLEVIYYLDLMIYAWWCSYEPLITYQIFF